MLQTDEISPALVAAKGLFADIVGSAEGTGLSAADRWVGLANVDNTPPIKYNATDADLLLRWADVRTAT